MSWAAVAAAAATVIGGAMSNSSAKKAASAQVAGMQQGADTINGYYNDAKGYMQPYMQTGTMANSGLQKLLGGDYSDFYNSPDFKAAMQAQGDMADNSAASRGMLFSGAHQKDLAQYGTGLATQGLGNYRNWLGGVQQGGQQAAGGLGELGMGAGNSLANLYSGMGNARGSSYAQQGANNANMMGGIGSMFGSIFGGK